MREGKEVIIQEFLVKDNENYKLKPLGFIRDLEEETFFLQQLAKQHPFTTFSKWKQQLMTHYYIERQFSHFVRTNINTPQFIETIHEKACYMVEAKYREKRDIPEVDIYLNPDKGTIAYIMPHDLFLNYYHRYFTPEITLNTPTELYHYCLQITNTIFPLSCQEILELANNSTPSICDKISRWLKKMIRQDCPDRDDIHHEVYIAFIEAIRKKQFAKPDNPHSVRNYAIGIIKNKYLDAQSQRRKIVLGNELTDIQLSNHDSPETDEQLMRNEKILNLLQNPAHPLRKELFLDIEEKIELLTLHFLDGLSYEEIALRKYGKLSPEKLKKVTNKFRQDICRVKAPLRSRLEKIIPIL